jgi:hypothetical protein
VIEDSNWQCAFRLGGFVDVLGLISASTELNAPSPLASRTRFRYPGCRAWPAIIRAASPVSSLRTGRS